MLSESLSDSHLQIKSFKGHVKEIITFAFKCKSFMAIINFAFKDMWLKCKEIIF